MWPFLKELVKLKQVFLWVLRTGCALRSEQIGGIAVRAQVWRTVWRRPHGLLAGEGAAVETLAGF